MQAVKPKEYKYKVKMKSNSVEKKQEGLIFMFIGTIISYILYRFAGDVAELGIIRAGEFMKVKAELNPRVHLVS